MLRNRIAASALDLGRLVGGRVVREDMNVEFLGDLSIDLFAEGRAPG